MDKPKYGLKDGDAFIRKYKWGIFCYRTHALLIENGYVYEFDCGVPTCPECKMGFCRIEDIGDWENISYIGNIKY